MTGYTPTTMEVIRKYATGATWQHQGYSAAEAEFLRWLAAHDAALRAEWEAEVSVSRVTTPGTETGAETRQGTEEPEWEYVVCGYQGRGLYMAPTLEEALAGIAKDRARSETKPKRTIKLRRKAGPWVPVEQGDES